MATCSTSPFIDGKSVLLLLVCKKPRTTLQGLALLECLVAVTLFGLLLGLTGKWLLAAIHGETLVRASSDFTSLMAQIQLTTANRTFCAKGLKDSLGNPAKYFYTLDGDGFTVVNSTLDHLKLGDTVLAKQDSPAANSLKITRLNLADLLCPANTTCSPDTQIIDGITYNRYLVSLNVSAKKNLAPEENSPWMSRSIPVAILTQRTPTPLPADLDNIVLCSAQGDFGAPSGGGVNNIAHFEFTEFANALPACVNFGSGSACSNTGSICSTSRRGYNAHALGLDEMGRFISFDIDGGCRNFDESPTYFFDEPGALIGNITYVPSGNRLLLTVQALLRTEGQGRKAILRMRVVDEVTGTVKFSWTDALLLRGNSSEQGEETANIASQSFLVADIVGGNSLRVHLHFVGQETSTTDDPPGADPPYLTRLYAPVTLYLEDLTVNE